MDSKFSGTDFGVDTTTLHILPQPDPLLAQTLLTNCDLPTADLTPAHFANFLAYGTAEQLQGIIGLELSDDVALLRSLAVSVESRGLGYGQALVTAIEKMAENNGIRAIYLLTTTAERFFTRLGYTLTNRHTAPLAIQQTAEFRDLCPDSAVFMVKSPVE